MKTSAIIMASLTGAVVTFVTLRYFIKVIKTPQKKDN